MFLVIGLSFQINIGRNDILIKNCRLKSEKSKRFKYSSQYMNFHIGNFQTEKPSSDKAADLGHQSSLLNKSISC